MKNFIIHIAISFLNIYIEMRRYLWKFRKKLSRTISLKLSKDDKICLYTKGELVGILYAHQPKTFWDKGFEHRTINLMKSIVREGMTVIDVGANIGIYSILLSKLVGKSGSVYAFEPDAKTFDILNKNLQLSNCNNVKTFQLALSDTITSVKLRKPDNELGDAFHYIEKIENNSSNIDDVIRTITLDDFVNSEKLTTVDFLKIDIEGAEFLCLKGGKKFLEKNNPVIICECFEDYLNRFDNSISEVIIYMDRLGFNSRNYDFQQWLFRKIS